MDRNCQMDIILLRRVGAHATNKCGLNIFYSYPNKQPNKYIVCSCAPYIYIQRITMCPHGNSYVFWNHKW